VGEIISLRTGEKVSLRDIKDFCEIFIPDEHIPTMAVLTKHAEFALNVEREKI